MHVLQKMKLKHLTTTLLMIMIMIMIIFRFSESQRTCPRCGSKQVPYPLSTNPNCGDPNYSLFCNPNSQHLYLPALNGSSYLILKIQPLSQTFVIRPSPFINGQDCTTQDMVSSGGLWLNQSLPFNITNSNTVFLFNCSPRLLLSPLNCTAASLCHQYLEQMAPPAGSREESSCARGPGPCCTFIAGGTPSSYKIRLHVSACRAFRSVIRPDLEKRASEWEEGMEIQWASPPNPPCRTQADCDVRTSACSLVSHRCLCNTGYVWDSARAICTDNSDKERHRERLVGAGFGSLGLALIVMALAIFVLRFRYNKFSKRLKMKKEREEMVKASSKGKTSARMFSWREMKKATNGFARENLLGVGGFGEVYKGVLQDGTLVAVKSAKVGNVENNIDIYFSINVLKYI